jgi:hypothetical protein
MCWSRGEFSGRGCSERRVRSILDELAMDYVEAA